MNLDLKGKIAIVTGGSEGIGRSISETLSREGVKVSICSRRFDILNDAAIDITKRTGVEVLPIQADVTNVEDIDNLVNSTVTHFGGVDILVNNAGTAASKYFEDVSDELWNSDLDLKLMGAIRCSKAELPFMKKQKWGRIINITTVGGKQPGASSMPTSISRAAGLGLTKALSHDYAKDNILVNTVCIGLVKSNQWIRKWESEKNHETLDELYHEMGKSIPMKRVGETEEVANVVAFLASERASYVTGSSINLDGGTSGVL